jgi:hypothetical protein
MTGGETHIKIRKTDGSKFNIISSNTQILPVYEKILHAITLGKKVVLDDCYINASKMSALVVSSYLNTGATAAYIDATIDVYSGDGSLTIFALQITHTFATNIDVIRYFTAS